MEQGEHNLPEFTKKTNDEFPVFEKKSPRIVLNIRALVWNRKSHGLYDYESKEITRSNLIWKQNGKIIRKGERIIYNTAWDNLSELEDEEDDPKELAFIKQASDTEFSIEPKDEKLPLSSRIWLVVRSLKWSNLQDNYIIQPNDIIKIGRVVIRVTELNTTFHEPEDEIDEEFDDILNLEDEPVNSDAWKFWWSTEEDEENPKMCPWKWTGSMRYIHIIIDLNVIINKLKYKQ